MQSIYINIVSMAFIGFVCAGFLEDYKEFFDRLENSVKETKKALSEEQLKDISSIVEKIGGFGERYEFTEPIFEVPKLYLPAAISEHLHFKENLGSKLEILLDDHGGMAFYREKFDKNIGKPCEEINRIWSPTLDAYYAIHRYEELFKQIKKYDQNDSEMLLNAGFCHNVMKNSERSVMDAFIFFACTMMNPGQSCFL